VCRFYLLILAKLGQSVYPELFKFALCMFSEVMSSECLSITVIFYIPSVEGFSMETVAGNRSCILLFV
jgi:hypothetical protein